MAECDTSRTLLFSARAYAIFCDKRTRISTRCLFLFSPGSFSWLSDLDKVLYTEAMALCVCAVGGIAMSLARTKKVREHLMPSPLARYACRTLGPTTRYASGHGRAFRHSARQVPSMAGRLGFSSLGGSCSFNSE
jgi:hypothetical protein